MVRKQRRSTSRGILSFDLVKAMHEEGTFHVARQEYPPNLRLPGRTRAATWYILQGSCRLWSDGEAHLAAGDVADVPAGKFLIEVGEEGVVIAQVWDLRPHMD